jgi:hypothetical protein
VLRIGYAIQIARDWNTQHHAHAGYVTRFNIDNEYAKRFERKVVGGREHQELWIPAEELNEFNGKLLGHIEVVTAYFAKGFEGSRSQFGFAKSDSSPITFFEALCNTLERTPMDFRGAVVLNARSVFCNYAYWKQLDSAILQVDNSKRVPMVIEGIRDAWHDNFPGISLPTEVDVRAYEADHIA